MNLVFGLPLFLGKGDTKSFTNKLGIPSQIGILSSSKILLNNLVRKSMAIHSSGYPSSFLANLFPLIHSCTSSFHHQVSLSSFFCLDDIPRTFLAVFLTTSATVAHSCISFSQQLSACLTSSLNYSQQSFFLNFHHLIFGSVFTHFLFPCLHGHSAYHHPMLFGHTLTHHHLAITNLFQVASST